MPLLGTRGAGSARGFGFGGAKSFPAIGEAFGGGYYAGPISVNATQTATHLLIIAPISSGYSSSKQWKTSDTDTPTSAIDGYTNSETYNSATYPAMQFCRGLSIGGFSDWYLPALYELVQLYYYLKSTSAPPYDNSTSYGATVYSVSPQPYNTNNTSTNPNQTPATDFQYPSGSQHMANEIQTSTQGGGFFPTENRYTIEFTFGIWQSPRKSVATAARAIRKVPV